LENVSVGANITLAHSEVDLREVTINESGLTEYESRVDNARVGERVEAAR